MKYFGEWNTYEEMRGAFEPSTSAERGAYYAGFPLEDQILFASYDLPGYEGDAIVVFERDGTLYEVNGSHCSCNGLEDRWEPEETTREALAMREFWCHSDEAQHFLHTLMFDPAAQAAGS